MCVCSLYECICFVPNTEERGSLLCSSVLAFQLGGWEDGPKSIRAYCKHAGRRLTECLSEKEGVKNMKISHFWLVRQASALESWFWLPLCFFSKSLQLCIHSCYMWHMVLGGTEKIVAVLPFLPDGCMQLTTCFLFVRYHGVTNRERDCEQTCFPGKLHKACACCSVELRIRLFILASCVKSVCFLWRKLTSLYNYAYSISKKWILLKMEIFCLQLEEEIPRSLKHFS